MPRTWQIALGAPLCLMFVACSPPGESKKAEAPTAAKDEPVPDVFRVTLDTSKGAVAIEVRREWAPRGADHFYSLVKTGFYDGNRFFRVVRNFVVQFGINGDPQLNRLWANSNLPDDPVKLSNVKGTLTYAHLGPNSRSTQLFINLKDNKSLDKQGFAPIGKVISGMDTVERFYSSYGEMAPRGQGPDPVQIEVQGNAYLADHFARLDYINKATIQ
jgi:peptidyl-prolyl cis-trans isomerase A (cyclophilin A)